MVAVSFNGCAQSIDETEQMAATAREANASATSRPYHWLVPAAREAPLTFELASTRRVVAIAIGVTAASVLAVAYDDSSSRW
jgi:hypothetical protein